MNKNYYQILGALFIAMSFTACGKSVQSSNVGGLNSNLSGNNLYNNYNGSAGCVPITSAIPFSGSNVYFDTANVIGGNLPNGYQGPGTSSQLVIGSSGVALNQNYNNTGYNTGLGSGMMQLNGSSPDGTIQMTVTQANGTKTASVQGSLQLSQYMISMIMAKYAQQQYNNQPVYNGQYPQQQPYNQSMTNVCVSAIAINLGHYNTSLYGGNVFLYLNNQNSGVVVTF